MLFFIGRLRHQRDQSVDRARGRLQVLGQPPRQEAAQERHPARPGQRHGPRRGLGHRRLDTVPDHEGQGGVAGKLTVRRQGLGYGPAVGQGELLQCRGQVQEHQARAFARCASRAKARAAPLGRRPVIDQEPYGPGADVFVLVVELLEQPGL